MTIPISVPNDTADSLNRSHHFSDRFLVQFFSNLHELNIIFCALSCKKSGYFTNLVKTFTIRKVNHFHSKENDT